MIDRLFSIGRTDHLLFLGDRRYAVYVQTAKSKQDKRCKGANLGGAVLSCRGTRGTSLIIRGLAMNQHLTLCEVVVWGKGRLQWKLFSKCSRTCLHTCMYAKMLTFSL